MTISKFPASLEVRIPPPTFLVAQVHQVSCQRNTVPRLSHVMQTLDWSVETLGLGYNSTGLCIHVYKQE